MSTLKHSDGAKSAQVEPLQAQRELACPGGRNNTVRLALGAGWCDPFRYVTPAWQRKKQHVS